MSTVLYIIAFSSLKLQMTKLWKIMTEFAVVLLTVVTRGTSLRHDTVLACWEFRWPTQNGF